MTAQPRGNWMDRRPGAGLLKRVFAFRLDTRLENRLAARAETGDVMELPEPDETTERPAGRADGGYGHGV